jgi:hypothetical protein
MGTVHLTSSHHGLYIRNNTVDLEKRVVLDAEMLMRPIFNGEHPNTSPTQHVIRGALQGLMDLPGFNAAISYRVIERDGVPHIAIPKRVWGEVTLETSENVVLGFSHDSRYDNRPYSSLLQWLEEDEPSGELNDDEFERFCLEWSSAEKWRNFFEARIRRQLKFAWSEIKELQLKAVSLTVRADTIAVALGCA